MSEDEIISWANGEVDGPTLRIRELGRDLGQVKAELAETRKALLQMQKERDKWKALADRLAAIVSKYEEDAFWNRSHKAFREEVKPLIAEYEAATKG